jgi:hypothetical protein
VTDARMESPVERAFGFALLTAVVGAFGGLGVMIAFLIAGRGLAWPLIPAFAAGGLAIGFVVGLLGRETAGGLVAHVIGGGRGYARSEFSHAQSLVIRGAYTDAVEEYRAAADAEPRDPRPLVLGAHVLRDHLRDPATAAAWLSRACEIKQVAPEEEAAIVRELIELYAGPLQTPARALPELARLADKHRGTPTGDWAAARLATLRTRLWEDVKGG